MVATISDNTHTQLDGGGNYQSFPTWIQDESKVTYTHTNKKYYKGFTIHTDNSAYAFRFQKRNLTILWESDISNIIMSFQELVDTGQLIPSYLRNKILLSARHVSAVKVQCSALPSLKKSTHVNHLDWHIWEANYKEDFDNIRDLSMYEQIRKVYSIKCYRRSI